MRISKSIYVRAAVVTLVATAAVLAYYARGIEPGITFATGGIDLKIDSVAYYLGKKVPASTWLQPKDLVPGSDKFFNFDDIKPGDYGCNVISMHVKKEHAWLCLDFKNLEQNENGENEPEGLEDATPGPDLADGTEFFGWMDDGDGKFEPPNEKAIFGTSTQAASYVFASTTYAIADSRGSMCRAATKRYVGMCWCAGDLTVQNDGKFNCNPETLGNIAQTDSFSVDVAIRAEAARLKPGFKCGGYPPVKPPCESCSGPINITVNNSGFINSTTTASSNTGGNTAGGGGTVNTGNASSTSTSTNTNNTTEINGGNSGVNDIRDFLNELLKRIR